MILYWKCNRHSVSYSDNYIDKHNIYNATYDCMHNSLDELNVRPDFVLVDGSDFQIYTKKKQMN